MAARNAEFVFHTRDGGPVLAVSGDWTVWTIGAVETSWRDAIARAGHAARLDLAGLGRMDMAGAYLIDQADAAGYSSDYPLLVAARKARLEAAKSPAPPAESMPILERVGRATYGLGLEIQAILSFLGLSIVRLARAAVRPQDIRWTSVVSVMETAGFNAVAIAAMLALFVGVALAYLGSQALTDLGAQLLTVEMVSASMLRAFGALVTAILLAGRTVSSFTAQIGAMKMRQEIDAMRVLGMDPFDTLVTPRLIAMVIMTPILTFIAMIAGMAGGMAVCWFYLDISPAFYVSHVQALKASYFWGGLVKAPLFGLVLAQVGCRHGLQTGADVSSLGASVTSAVVQGIFLIIFLNVVLEFWFVGMGW